MNPLDTENPHRVDRQTIHPVLRQHGIPVDSWWARPVSYAEWTALAQEQIPRLERSWGATQVQAMPLGNQTQ